ncbi:hypothetical protein [Corynebacterium sp. 22KM0430]|nr:hypothetical protein [Corynebacterium sp. 22KM0430]WPF66474.1 hypothetical protein OLX12_01740 [Corynebacterium sp. 22KM0430]
MANKQRQYARSLSSRERGGSLRLDRFGMDWCAAVRLLVQPRNAQRR